MTAQLLAPETDVDTHRSSIIDHSRAPFLETLKAAREANVQPFTTPGHKLGVGADPELVALLGPDLFANDIWLNTGAYAATLRAAESLAADAWGAERTHFLVNGSSSGNLAALLALVRPGDEVIVGRDMHRSLLAALVVTGARPIYVAPRLHPTLGISLGVSPDDVAAALDRHPAARLVALVSPTYYGTSADLRGIVRVSHDRDVPVFVDEAWGPHFAFHPALPDSAMQAGADIAVNSAHKLLGCLSQGAMLHVQGERVDQQRLAAAVAMTQTTSPLLPILASIDTSRRQMALDGEDLLERTLWLARQARQRIARLPGISVIDASDDGWCASDPTRLVIDVVGLGMTGYNAEHALRAGGVAPEMSDLHSVVCLITIGDRQSSIDRLVEGLAHLASAGQERPGPARTSDRALGAAIATGTTTLPPGDAFHAPARSVAPDDATGEVCAEMVVPYPPGIPVLLPGELITAEKIAYLQDGHARGMTLNGASDPTLATIRVVE